MKSKPNGTIRILTGAQLQRTIGATHWTVCMARKRKLDPYTSLFVDRHGKERCRFRRMGLSCYLPHPSAKGYQEAYRRALEGLAPSAPLEPR
jgi:hypothetical protein